MSEQKDALDAALHYLYLAVAELRTASDRMKHSGNTSYATIDIAVNTISAAIDFIEG